jgi:uncharacterized membrane protein
MRFNPCIGRPSLIGQHAFWHRPFLHWKRFVVEQLQNAQQQIILVRPNQSATWELNLRIIIALGAWSMLIAISFSLYGAWLILPFAGLEILALFAALYFVCRKLSLRQVIRIDADTITIEKGFYYPVVRWCFARQHTRLAVQAQTHPWDAIVLRVFSMQGDEAVEVGEFLNREESQQLLDILRGFAIPLRDHSIYSSQSF